MVLGNHPYSTRNIANIIETVIVVCLIAIIIAVIYKKYHTIEYEARKSLRRQEVSAIFMGVKLYKIKYGTYPGKLTDIIDENVFGKETVKIMDFDKRIIGDKLIDPFGKPYLYDNITGTVK
ncbi:MAG: hypothetical protein PWQ25_175 [Deferribacteres bacterium]|jgi:hypothetical protein|nr:hypothetical protein [Deferribacteraceae bacterium]MDK2791312.1 hypothetical protein [Deferribacteres bacterium]